MSATIEEILNAADRMAARAIRHGYKWRVCRCCERHTSAYDIASESHNDGCPVADYLQLRHST